MPRRSFRKEKPDKRRRRPFRRRRDAEPSPPTLIVSIDVDALCVGRPDVDGQDPGGVAMTLGPTADFSALPYVADRVTHNRGPYISADVLAGSVPFGGAVPLAQGVHLHWALPAGLSHAIAGADGRQDFPPVPERWLVTRIVLDVAVASRPTVSTRSWVVESDRLSATPTATPGRPQPTVPMQPTPGQNFRYLGASFDLASWRETGGAAERLTGLTAMGYGQPTFAGYYPNSCTSFGFLDTLADLTGYRPASSTISYHVAGWYGDAANDPMRTGKIVPGSNRYGWTWDGTVAPAATVCSGVVNGISWDPARQYLDDAPRPLTVAVADTGPEALSALMAAAAPGSPAAGDTERLLNALQFGLLSKSAQVDSQPSFEQAMHDAGFAAGGGGSVWSVVTVDKTAQGGEVPLPAQLADDLSALNLLQLRADTLTHELRTRRQQLFADWYKNLVIRYQPDLAPPELRDQLGTVQTFLSAQAQAIAAITQTGGTLDTLTAAIATAAQAIRAALPAAQSLRGDTPARPYREPAEPVLLLSGPDVAPAARHLAAGRDLGGAGLSCRLDTEVVTAVTLQAGAVSGSAQVTVPATALAALAALPDQAPAALLQALLREAILIAPALQPAVAAACAAQGGRTNPAVLDFAATGNVLRQAAVQFVAGNPPTRVSYTGSAPSRAAVHDWATTPWLPLLLQYEVAFRPLQYIDPVRGGAYAPDFVSANFQLPTSAVDLGYVHGTPQDEQLYSGSTLLGGRTGATMVDEIQRFLSNTGNADPDLTAILGQLQTLPLLAQQLTGAGQAMLMRELVLQLPVGDPLAAPPLARFTAQIAAAVGPENSVAPLPEASFNPLRTGTLSIRRLRVVDAFGRFRDFAGPSVLLSASLTPPPALNAPAGAAFLPPRLTQPARLLFRWLAAGDDQVETNSHPATTPVFGWLVPNWLDRALAVYATDGTPLGEFALSIDERTVLWTPAPGGAYPHGASVETVFAGQNPHLYGIAVAIYAGGDATFLAPFFAQIRESLDFTLPAEFRESAESAVLAGQPLALARAGLNLEVPGGTAASQSWPSFVARVLHGAAPDDAGLSAVRFPVRLGDPQRLDDSLIGFWVQQGDDTDWLSFYAPAATASNGGVRPPAQDTVTLSPTSDAGAGTVVTLLLDPRGVVHATTGVLPVEQITIPPEHYDIASLSLALATRPVLTASNTAIMSLALPKQHGAWNWVTVADGQWKVAQTADAPSSATLDYTPQQITEGWLVMP
ncbi:hypothetical protein [Acrocarpospora phusangensis]|nr:hypothetical protein [Acrocarpospora phusangensis]